VTRTIICDDSDREPWLRERRKKITASDMLVFLGQQPDWYSTNREELIDQKLNGTEPQFDHKAKVRMKHGRMDEANNLRKAGALLGYPVAEYHQFIGNTRWPYLGATLDGLLFPQMDVEPDLELTMQEGRVLETIEGLIDIEAPILVEMKQTEAHRYGKNGKPWIDFIPSYYIPQVQTQMWLASVPSLVLVGCLGAADMTAWLIDRDPEWGGILDAASKEAESILGGA
jgi:hypothetical protein